MSRLYPVAQAWDGAPRKEKAMPPEHITTAVGGPHERSEAQGFLLKHMSQLNQRLLGPWENADGQRLPRLTLAEAVAQLYEWSTAYRDHPELARDFAVMAARLARRLSSAGGRRAEEVRTAPMAHQGPRLLGGPERQAPPAQASRRP
jgi:hypothetical protein